VKAQRFESVFDALGTVEEHMTEAEEREQVAQVAPPVAKHGRAQDKGFAADTAQISGESKAAINRHLARAEALGDDLDKVTGTSLDKGVELDALKAMTPEQRAPLGGYMVATRCKTPYRWLHGGYMSRKTKNPAIF
jgi:hypothetical protein